MAVNEVLDEIENLVVDAKHFIFTNKAMVDENDLVRLVDDLRNELPLELKEAEDIVVQREKIIEAAQAEAARIRDAANKEAASTMEQAKAFAAKTVAEHEILRQAQEQAKEVENTSTAHAKEIVDQAMAQSTQMKKDIDTYCNQMMDVVIGCAGNSIQQIQQAMQVVQQAKQQMNQAANQ